MSNKDDILSGLIFFNEDEARIIEAISARIIPGDPDNPGAREAGATIYIDRSLAGFFSHLQTFYRERVAEFDLACRTEFGTSFPQLTEHQQDEFLQGIGGSLAERSVEGALRSEGKSRLSQFFTVVYEHTLEGTFGDPIYGGNRHAVGWKMVGFPGAQWSYSAEQMKPGFDARQIKITTLGDLQANLKILREGANE